ncbi:MAG: methyl-accepting chemotaxis protein [Nitrospirae bacterium]|nr:methyl-accepting chemotaxis protein [Nitrospirota bacterium]
MNMINKALGFFYNIGIKTKFYILIFLIVAGNIGGIISGLMLLSKAQIGGTAYKTIEGSMELADSIARQRVNMNIIRFNLSRMLVSGNGREESVSIIESNSERMDELFSKIEESAKKGGLTKVLKPMERASEAWSSFKDTAHSELMPLIMAGKTNNARKMIEGVQTESYNVFMEETKAAVDEARAQVPLMVKKTTAGVNAFKVIYLTGGVSICIATIAISWVLLSTIIKPVVKLSDNLKTMASGNFALRNIEPQGKDEIADMTKSFKEMGGNVINIIEGMRTGIDILASSSEELSSTADRLSAEAQEQTSQVEQVVISSTEMSQTINDVAKNAHDASQAAKNSFDVAEGGKKMVGMTVESMQRIADAVNEAVKTIEELGRSSAEIGEVISVIKDVADQTNLLALNAAIEAARAGEQGRGFAVVADEVRKLAERTAKATEDVEKKISSIQASIGSSVEAMRKGDKEVDKGNTYISTVNQYFESMLGASSTSLDMVQRIATAAEEQSSVADGISRHMSVISTSTAEASEKVKNAVYTIQALLSELKKHIEWVKIEEKASAGNV